MSTSFTKEQLAEKVTNVWCLTCNTLQEVTATTTTPIIDTLIHDDDDELYEEYGGCCTDPALMLLIIAEQPLFLQEDIDADAFVASNPSLGLYQDTWRYTVNDDLLTMLAEANILEDE
jgi:hypothetical protein